MSLPPAEMCWEQDTTIVIDVAANLADLQRIAQALPPADIEIVCVAVPAGEGVTVAHALYRALGLNAAPAEKEQPR